VVETLVLVLVFPAYSCELLCIDSGGSVLLATQLSVLSYSPRGGCHCCPTRGGFTCLPYAMDAMDAATGLTVDGGCKPAG